MIIYIPLLLVSLLVIGIGGWGVFLLISSRCFLSAPAVPSSGPLKQTALSLLTEQLKNKSHQTVVDLGSGWGTLLLPLARQFPNHHFVGVERSFFPYWMSCWRARKYSNLTFERQDLFQYNLKKAQIVIVFLMPYMLEKVYQKCLLQAKAGTLVFSNRFSIPHLHPIKRVGKDPYNRVFLYRL